MKGVRGWKDFLVLVNRRLNGHTVVHGWGQETPYPNGNAGPAPSDGALGFMCPLCTRVQQHLFESAPLPPSMTYNRGENKEGERGKCKYIPRKSPLVDAQ